MYYLKMMDESLDMVKLSKFFYSVVDCRIDVEFTEDEVEEFNIYIKDNDYSSIINFLSSKRNVSMEILKDMINAKYDSIWQLIMDESYKKWEHNDMSRTEFLNQLTDYEKTAVLFGNFNYQVENGGLYQWHENGYSEDKDFLYEFIENCNFVYKEEFLNILDNFGDVIDAVEKLDRNDDWYEEDYKTRMNALNHYDKDYYKIQEDWKENFDIYLLENIPDEYIKKITELNEDIKI